jgi:hypothetical protein
MSLLRATILGTRARKRLAIVGVLSLAAFAAQLTAAIPAAATPFSGGVSPTIFGGLADLNGDDEVTGRDDANAFYGDTHIIDGGLDCDAWTGDNDGTGGDGVIDGGDDCTLIGYDGTVDGVTIPVVDGSFDVSDGSLPTVFNAADPDNPSVLASDFAWSTINGAVDSNGNEGIGANDCHLGLIGKDVDGGLGDATDGADILGNTLSNTNPCGFATPPAAADNGKVDINSDTAITGADSCDSCFFGHPVSFGLVQESVVTPPPVGTLTGTFSPTIVSGLADLNGDGTVTGRDDANAFYGETHIIDGGLDCNAWTGDNDGTAGDGVIDGGDDCRLIGYDGTADGVAIDVVDGEFQVANGPLPGTFNANDPNNPDIGASDFAWSAIGGRVDSSGNEVINAGDCHFGLIGKTVDAGLGDPTDGADILGNDLAETNPCGFANPPDAAENGLVDLNSDGDITAADSCTDGCFFGLDVREGFVMASATPECPGFEGDPRHDVIGTSGADILVGTPRRDIICAKGGNDTLAGRGRNDLLLGGGGNDLSKGGPGADTLRGGSGSDVLRGGRGNDQLYGGRGNDHLAGGAGFDLGVGGPGVDEIVGCERRQQ